MSVAEKVVGAFAVGLGGVAAVGFMAPFAMGPGIGLILGMSAAMGMMSADLKDIPKSYESEADRRARKQIADEARLIAKVGPRQNSE